MKAEPVLPPEDDSRVVLHNEVHARPAARIRLPALVLHVAVANAGVTVEAEFEHLRCLPGQQQLDPTGLRGGFLRLRLPGCTLKWERHSEFSRYSIVQQLPPAAMGQGSAPDLLADLAVGVEWLHGVPGRTIAAIELVMVAGDVVDPRTAVELGQRWFGRQTIVASVIGEGHSIAMTDFQLDADGFERMLVVSASESSETRVGRVSQRLLEFETYRLMALRGLPIAKELGPMLAQAETALADIAARLEGRVASEQALLDDLVHLAAQVERAIAQHSFRFAATAAYDTLVRQRIAELRETAVSGTQTIGQFMQRRLSPAMATVAATSSRLESLARRIERSSALLRTRVDIATAAQNQQLLAKLTRGQELQLRLQSTVEGLSIATISYYVISLLMYGAKAAKASGLPIDPEMATGALIPWVLWAVWKTTRRVHSRIHGG